MSSTPQKSAPKMCKSPKNSAFQATKSEKIQIINEYENLSTNCTVIGSNNLHLVKKPQMVTSMSPAYSNPSPGYPPSPYSSPASLKSPSPQSFKPPTPQPSFPVMQIIHSSHQLVARPIQTSQPQNVIKLKPHLNILPKPSASPQPPPKPSVSPHIVIPSQQTTTIMPTAQPLLLNQMPMLAPGVQLILRPQTTKIPTHVQTAAPQGLILQPSGQQLLQIQSPRTAQPMMRVLTNGVHLAPQTQVVSQVASPVITHTTTQQAQIMQNDQHLTMAHTNSENLPKKKPKNKKKKLDLANIMKLSGIGDEDDIQFESDTSQSESEPNMVQLHSDMAQPQHSVIQEANIIRSHANVIQATDSNKRIGNIQISAVAQPTVSTATPLVQLLNQSFQSGVNSTSFQAASQTAAPAGIPLNSFITPNITINNGLVVQRNGGFKLALGEDGRLVLQHDPTLNQDLQSQLLLQSIFGLNGLVLQPSMDQQVHSQTVQTIQQQSVQTIQQQTVQSQTIQTVQQQTVQPHHLQTIQQTIQPQIQTVQPQTVQQTVQQTIQHQTVQSQPLSALQQHTHTQPMQIVQPQPIHTIQSHNIQQHTIQSQPVQSLQSPTVQAIQSQVHQSIQSQIQGQIQSLLQSQPLQTLQSQPLQTLQSQPLQTLQSQPLQTLQSQPLQTLQSVQPQPVHSQPQSSHVTPTIQSQHQTVHSQPVLKVQPFQKTPPVQTVHPQPVQPIQTIHHPPHQQNLNDNQQQNPPSQTSYIVNLTPDQLEQLKRNGQLTVNGQTIFMQRPNATNKTPEPVNHQQNNENKVKLSPKIKPVKKVNRIQTNSSATKNIMQENVGIKNVNHTTEKIIKHVIRELPKSSLVTALQAPPKIIPPQNQAQVQPQQKIQLQPSAVVPPSVTVQPTVQSTVSSHTQTPKPPVQAKVQGTQTSQSHILQDGGGNNQDVDHILGQFLDESNNTNNVSTSTTTATTTTTTAITTTSTTTTNNNQSQPTPPQRVHTIHLTLQQQQHLKNIQLQMQALSARATPGDTEMQTALKLLFAEQQKILASGKLLPPDKVIYQNNQLTIINPSSLGIGNCTKTETQVLQTPIMPRTSCSSSGGGGSNNNNTSNNSNNETSNSHPMVTAIPTTPVPKITVTIPAVTEHITHTSAIHPVTSTSVPTIKVPLTTSQAPTVLPYMQQNKYIPSFTKAQLMEQQLNTDQNGAMKPDVHTPFRDKADACKRLVRYHCYNQPVLSEKDLSKADEIFELTARHFIDKFSKMVDKYRFLLLKESMRQVQTSELMMLDRMFLAEEQQSLIRLRHELEEGPPPDLVAQIAAAQQGATISVQDQQQPQEEYDEWACIQRELGCLQSTTDDKSTNVGVHQQQQKTINQPQQSNQNSLQQSIVTTSYQPPKRSASSDSRLETLKKFRVDKHSKRHNDSVNVQNNFMGGGNIQQSNNFNVPGGVCSASKTHSMRVSHDVPRSVQQQPQQSSFTMHNTQSQVSSSSTNMISNVQNVRVNLHSNIPSQQQQQVMQHGSRNMHYTTTQHPSTQGAYHSTNILHQQQYTHNVQFLHSQDTPQNMQTMYNPQMQQANQHGAPSQHNINTSNSVHSSVNNNNNNNGVNNKSNNNNNSNNNVQSHGSQSSESESGNNSIDEHVQSAIDSILNLQQNSNLDLDEAVSSILS